MMKVLSLWSAALLSMLPVQTAAQAIPTATQEGELPFDFWDKYHLMPGVAESLQLPVNTSESNLVRVTDPDSGVSFRLADLSVFLAMTDFTSFREPSYDEAGAILFAIHRWNEQSRRRGDCDIRFTSELINSESDALKGTSKMTEILSRPRGDLTQPRPAAVIGSYRSAVSAPLAILNFVQNVPQVSGASSSAYLDDGEVYPIFGRTVPSSDGEARAIIDYFVDLDVRRLGILYFGDAFGAALQKSCQDYATTVGVETAAVSYITTEEDEIRQVVQQLQEFQFLHILYIGLETSDFEVVMTQAHMKGLASGRYAWLLYGFEATSLQIQANSYQPGTPLHDATRGIGVLELGPHPRRARQRPGELADEPIPAANRENPTTANERFRVDWENMVANPEFQAYLASKWPDTVPDGTLNAPVSSVFAYFMFDAVTATAMAMCMTEEEFFVGADMIQHFPSMRFDGASGNNTFNEDSTRDYTSVRFTVLNFQANDVDGREGFDIVPALESVNGVWMAIPGAQFIFADGTTNPPLDLLPAETDVDKVNIGVRGAGLFLAFATAVFFAYCVVWTFVNRNQAVVCAAQPTFLYLIAIGSIIQAGAVVPLSLVDQSTSVACMTMPWIYFLGLALTTAALYAKTWRLRELLLFPELDRLFVSKTDFILWLSAVFGTHVVLMVVWTALLPLRYDLVYDDSTDKFGRPRSSFGVCQGRDGEFPSPFLVVAILGNAAVLLVSIWWSFRARQIETEYSETQFTGFAVGVVFEAMVIGGSMQYVTRETPDAFYVISLAMVTLTSLGAGMLIFVPKMLTFRLEKKALEEERRLKAAATSKNASKARADHHEGDDDSSKGSEDFDHGDSPEEKPEKPKPQAAVNGPSAADEVDDEMTELGLRIFYHPRKTGDASSLNRSYEAASRRSSRRSVE